MSDSTAVKQRLPSPPASLSGDIPPAMEQLMKYEPRHPYTPELYAGDNHRNGHSGHNTSYNSPARDNWMEQQHTSNAHQDTYQQSVQSNQDMSIDWYGSPMHHHQQNSPYHTGGHTPMQYPDPQYAGMSPPTLGTSDSTLADIRKSRSGRPLVPNVRAQKDAGKSPLSGSPRVRKTKQPKGDKPKMKKLDAPLSVLTKDYHDHPVRDMEKWVHRSAEVRNAEVQNRNGYITRPMNSFMLYRSAYAERTKHWCEQNNHQIVSSVSGESWPMEPPDVRELYNEYARIERDNHQKAHPGYKFSPAKTQNSRKKTPVLEDSEDDILSEPADPDDEWRPAGERRKNRTNKRQGREVGYPANSMSYNRTDYGIQASIQGYNKSSYQAVNPGKPLPSALNDQGMYGQYYQPTVYPNLSRPNVEDVRIQRMPMPGMQSGSAPPSLIGLPGGLHVDLLDPDVQGDNSSTSGQQMVQHMDPNLSYNSEYMQHANGLFTEQNFQQFNEDLFGTSLQQHDQQGTSLQQLEQQSRGDGFQTNQNTLQFDDFSWLTEEHS